MSERDPREVEHVTRVTIAKKVSKKNLKAKSPLRFTNKYRAVPSSSDLSERRVRPPTRLCQTLPDSARLDLTILAKLYYRDRRCDV